MSAISVAFGADGITSNDKGSAQRIAYTSHSVAGAAFIVILWLRAGDVETIVARLELRNLELACLIRPDLKDCTSTLPVLQIPTRRFHARRVVNFALLKELGIRPASDRNRGARHGDRAPFFIVTLPHQVYSPAAYYRPGQLSLPHRRRFNASYYHYIARID